MGGLVVLWTVLHNLARARRLYRLHRRTDAARVALASALERRAGAALAVAAALEGAGRPAGELRPAVAAARSVVSRPYVVREPVENVLGRRLAVLDRSWLPAPILDELIDAEQLLILARSVHNDAVRDTLVLRSRRLVRWLHLAGTAPLPEYIEIADAEPEARGRGREALGRQAPSSR